MIGSISAGRLFGFEGWLGLPASRARCVRHFVALAATLAAAKVLLATIGVTLFVAEQGVSALPAFYIGFSVIAIGLSFGLGAIIDRCSKVRLAQATFAGVLIGTAALRLLLHLQIPGVPFALLASAHVFEIILDIVFWVVVAAYLDSFELKRATPLFYMALAIGGAAGGVSARLGVMVLPPADLLWLLLPLAALVVVQFVMVAKRLVEVPDHQRPVDGSDTLGHNFAQLGRLLRRYPLAALIALNALVVTLLFGLSEFLILSIYEDHFANEAELARFLSLLFALTQLAEFGLLYTLSQTLLERTGPLLRNLVFPMTSLASLIYLVMNQKLAAAIVIHLNVEAVCNAIFLPVNNANYISLPLRFHGRARTLSEGVFYPSGLAIAGALLWSMDAAGAATAVEFVAILFVLVFVVLNVGVGVLFPPTLIANLRSGVVPLAELSGRIVGLPASAAPRVREFLRSSRSDLRLDGIALSRWLGPAQVTDDLVALASHPDAATRRALVRLAGEADGDWVRRFIDAAYGRDDRSSMVAMQVMLARRDSLPAERPAALRRSDAPGVLALAALVGDHGNPSDIRARLAPMLGDAPVAAEVVDAIVAARRADLAELVVAALPAAPAEQQRHGLEFVHLVRPRLTSPSWRALGRFVRHRDPGVRAEAMAMLGGCPHRASRRALARGLADRSARVRRRAADALGAHGEDAVDALVARLVPIRLGSVEAARALGRMNTAPARRALVGSLRQLRRDARDNAHLLNRLGAAPDGEPWRILVTCARDHRARMVELALAALSRSLPQHVLGHVRDTLRSKDRRRRADAFEVLAALSRAGPVAEAIETLRVILLGLDAGEQSTAPGERFDARATLALARRSRDPWVSQAAGIVEARIFASGCGPAPVPRRESHAMIPNEQDLERILLLKQIPLFQYLPLDTLFAVAHSVQARRWLPGDVIAADGRRLEHCHILEAGVVSIDRGGTTERLAAPACFNELVLIGEVAPIGRIVALEPCRVLHLHAVAFQDLGRDHPEILLELCRMLARRVRAAEGSKGSPGPVQPSGASSTPTP